jgi:hypothetical protein
MTNAIVNASATGNIRNVAPQRLERILNTQAHFHSLLQTTIDHTALASDSAARSSRAQFHERTANLTLPIGGSA